MMTIRFRGIAKNQRMLNNLVKPDEIKQALIKAGFAIQERAQILAPVDTGRLRASISTNWDGSGMSKAQVESPAKVEDGVSQPTKGSGELAVVRVGTNVDYAIYQEFGTRKMPPHPFLMPAADRGMAVFNQEIEKIIDKNKVK